MYTGLQVVVDQWIVVRKWADPQSAQTEMKTAIDACRLVRNQTSAVSKNTSTGSCLVCIQAAASLLFPCLRSINVRYAGGGQEDANALVDNFTELILRLFHQMTKW